MTVYAEPRTIIRLRAALTTLVRAAPALNIPDEVAEAMQKGDELLSHLLMQEDLTLEINPNGRME